MDLTVRSTRLGSKLNRLEVFEGDQLIGEYERSQEADIERKKMEVTNSQDLLSWVYRKHNKPFVVRWNAEGRYKSVCVGEVEVAIIPKKLWQTPSWES